MSGWQQPTLTSNGTWEVDDFAVRGWDNSTYLAFDGTTKYLNGTNTDRYIEIWIKDGLALGCILLVSSDGYLTTRGTIAYSDDGKTYIDCGTWSADNGNRTTVTCTNNDVHKYFRLFQSTLLIRGATAILLPLHFSSFHPPFSRTSFFPSSDISFLQQYLSSAFLCDSTSRASKESSVLPDHRCSLRRYVLSFPYNSSRDDKTADCLFSYRWPFRAYAGIPRTVLCRGCIRKQNSALFVRDARRSLLLA